LLTRAKAMAALASCRATVFEHLGDEGMPPSIEFWHGDAADHRALADKILDQVAAAP